MADGGVSLEAVEVGSGDAEGNTVDFRLLPFDGKGNRSVEECVEIEGVLGLFPEIVGFDLNIFLDGLFDSTAQLITMTRAQRRAGVSAENVGGEAASAGVAGEDKIFVIRGFHGARIRAANHGPGRLNEIRKTDSWLEQFVFADAFVVIKAEAGADGEVLDGDLVLDENVC